MFYCCRQIADPSSWNQPTHIVHRTNSITIIYSYLSALPYFSGPASLTLTLNCTELQQICVYLYPPPLAAVLSQEK